jgi:hypothetical protein
MDVGNWVILSILLGYKFGACVLYMLVGVGETKNWWSVHTQYCWSVLQTL